MKRTTKRKKPVKKPTQPAATTLLDVITAVSEASSTEDEVVAVIHDLLKSGSVRLAGAKDPVPPVR